jgi:hypothetical protein
LSKRETVLEAQLTGLGLWKIKIGTLEDQVQEDFNYPNHDPDRNRLFYLIAKISAPVDRDPAGTTSIHAPSPGYERGGYSWKRPLGGEGGREV